MKAFDGVIRKLRVEELNEAVDSPGSFDEDDFFPFRTLGQVISSVNGFISFLAGEASMIRLALGKSASTDAFGDCLDSSSDSSDYNS